VDIACGIAVCVFNDGAQALVSLANHLDLQPYFLYTLSSPKGPP
jgi:hypothetical protein